MRIKQILIGLEIHIELKTKSKMFCGCSAESFGKEPNTLTCPVCLGLPGALPVPNKKAIEWAILLGLALNCQIPEESKFDRKNYFYPDLPKGYQISQYDKPFAICGWLKIKDKNENIKKIGIRRVHLEEDTAKSIHTMVNGEKVTLLDFDKSGIPLIEIVTEPDFNSVDEVLEFCKKIRQIVRYLEISDADLEKGQMRLEPTVNLLLEEEGREFFTPLVEIKNINSFRFLKRALEYEIERQFQEFSRSRVQKTSGNKTTRGFDENKMTTFEQRHKEEAEEYRYFPEPDIPPFRISEKLMSNVKCQMSNVELPEAKEKRFLEEYDLNDAQVEILTEEKELANYFEECVGCGKDEGANPQEIANVIVNKRIDFKDLSPTEFVRKIGESKSKFTLTESEIASLVDGTIKENPQVVDAIKKGKTQAIGFLTGQVQEKAKGAADPRKVQSILREKLDLSEKTKGAADFNKT